MRALRALPQTKTETETETQTQTQVVYKRAHKRRIKNLQLS